MKKYIILGNGFDWCKLSFHGIENRDDVLFIDSKLPLEMNKLTSKFARYYFSNTLNRKVQLPFKHLWYPSIYKNLCLEINEEQLLIIYDKNMLGNNRDFLKTIKHDFPKLKLIYAFTNIVKYSGAMIENFVEELNSYYDIVLAFDKLDAYRYGFFYSPIVYNANNVYHNTKCKNEVFYVGTAKDRFNMLIATYDKLKSMGIKCDFNIAEVDDSYLDYRKGIVFNRRMPYKEVLEHISCSECLLDVIQGESTGLTMKTCEAVCYNKKLITTNEHVKDYPFYDDRYILVIHSAGDITKDFFINNRNVRYKESDKLFFSTEAFFERIHCYLKMGKTNE